MDKQAEVLVKAHFEAEGLEAFLHGGGLENYVRVACGNHAPRKFNIDHRLLRRDYNQEALKDRLNEIVGAYKDSIAKKKP